MLLFFITLLRVSNTSFNWWFLAGVWVTASPLKSPGLFSVFSSSSSYYYYYYYITFLSLISFSCAFFCLFLESLFPLFLFLRHFLFIFSLFVFASFFFSVVVFWVFSLIFFLFLFLRLDIIFFASFYLRFSFYWFLFSLRDFHTSSN